ncbi:MAG: hypothetical protein FJ125_13220, partial [Deltaproteobacteria bacterium]|nr:hypothetical protein [Deltaproteobacteria bacterium]
YRYEVEAGQGAARTPLGDPTFRLSTAALPGETFTFAVYGDTRVGEAGSLRHHRSIVEQALAVEPSFVLLLGDLVDDGRQAALWEELFRIAAPLLRRAAAFPVLGESDHARGEGLAARYFPSLEQGWYHFAWGDAYFFGMLAWDTRGAQPAATFDEQSPQLRWLDGWLARPEVQGASFRVVFLHDPVQTVRGRSAERFRRVWGPLLARRRVDVVFASWHLYERSMRDGVVFVASGGAGAQLVWMAPEPGAAPALAEARRHHFCRVDVRPGAMEIRAIAEDGTMLDSVVLVPRPADGPAPSGLRRAAQALRRRISIPAAAADAPLVGMLLFCHARARCRRLLEHELPRQARQAGVALEVSLYDLGRQGSYELLRTAEADFGREAAVLPALFLGRTLLAGPTKIATGLPAELRAAAGDPAGYGQRAATPFARGHDARQLRAEELGRLDPPALLRAGVVDSTKPEAWSMLALLGLLLCSATGTLRQRLGRGALLVASLLGGMVGLAIVRHRYAGLPEAAVLLGLGVDALLLVLLLRRLARAPWPGRARPAAESSAAGQERWWSLLTGALLPALGLLLVPLQLLAAGRVYLPLVAALADPLQRAPAFARLLLYLVGFGAPLGAMLAGALLLQRGAAWLRSAKGGVAGAGSVATAGGAATTHWSWTTLSLLGQLAALAVLPGGAGS